MPIAGLPLPRAPVLLDEALRTACEGVAGITPAQFRALLSHEDMVDIAAGAIHPKTLKAYALSFAEGPPEEVRVTHPLAVVEAGSGRLVPAASRGPTAPRSGWKRWGEAGTAPKGETDDWDRKRAPR